MATLSSLQVAAAYPLRKHEKGMFAIHGEYTLTATLASADVIRMVKIPDGVTVHQIFLNHPNIDPDSASTPLLLNVGDGADTNRFAASHTAGRVGRFALGTPDMNTLLTTLPYRYDLSDNDPNHYDTIDIEVIAFSGTGTAGGTIKLTAFCTAEDELVSSPA